MKKIILIIFFFLAVNDVFGQLDTTYFFDEYSVSANRMIIQDDNSVSKYGIGLNVNRPFNLNDHLSMVTGLGYTITSILKKNGSGGHFTSLINVTYYISYLSLPKSINW